MDITERLSELAAVAGFLLMADRQLQAEMDAPV